MSKDKLNIGFFTDTYHPQINGVVNSIDIFKNELAKLGHKVFVFAPEAAGVRPNSNKSVFRFRSVKLFFHDDLVFPIPFSYSFLKKVPDLNLDIVHAHTPFSLGWISLLLSFIKGLPKVHTYHTLYPEYVKVYLPREKRLTPKITEKITVQFCNRCDLNIAPSPKIKKLMERYGVYKKIEVLPTGIDLENFKKPRNNNILKKYGLKPEDKILIFVGRVGKEKNIKFIFRVFEKLMARKPRQNLKLVIVGDGPAKPILEKIARTKKYSNRVVFTGFIPRDEVISFLYASDIFTFSSLTDTQGMVILEAMAAGLPVVALKDGAFSNVVEDKKSGLLVKNVNQFDQAVWRLLKDTRFAEQVSQNAKKRVRDFTAAKQAKQLLELYNNLINK